MSEKPNENSTRRKRVLILTASVGAGHNSVARAIDARLQMRDMPAEIVREDSLDYAPRWFRAIYAGGYEVAVTRFPWLYGLGYWWTDRPDVKGRRIGERVRLAYERRAMKRLCRYVLETQPDMIVHSHFLAPPMLSRLIAKHNLSTRQMIVVTDTDAHRYWYAENIAHWFVASEQGAERLSRWGIDPDRVTVSGIPVHPKWTAPLDRDRIYKEWNLPRDRQIVILSGGTMFTCGPVTRIARRIAEQAPDAFVLVLGGHNKKLLGQIASLRRENVRGVSFTDRIHELVDVADLVITKPGGAITSECISKATGMVLLKPVPGQEAHNAKHFEKHGAARVARSASDAVQRVVELMENQDALNALQENAHGLFRDSTRIVCDHVQSALNESPDNPVSCSI